MEELLTIAGVENPQEINVGVSNQVANVVLPSLRSQLIGEKALAGKRETTALANRLVHSTVVIIPVDGLNKLTVIAFAEAAKVKSIIGLAVRFQESKGVSRVLELNLDAATRLDSDFLQRSLVNVGSDELDSIVVHGSMDANSRCFGLGHDDGAHGVRRVHHDAGVSLRAVRAHLGSRECSSHLGGMHVGIVSRTGGKAVRNNSPGAGLVSLSMSHGDSRDKCIGETTAGGGSFNLVHESGSGLLVDCSVILNTFGLSRGLVHGLLLLGVSWQLVDENETLPSISSSYSAGGTASNPLMKTLTIKLLSLPTSLAS